MLYKKNNKNCSEENLKANGKIKDEVAVVLIKEFLDLRSKCICIVLMTNVLKCKGEVKLSKK